MVVVSTALCPEKREVKVGPSRGHEGPEGEYRYSCTLSLTSAIGGAGGHRHAPFLYVKT